MSSFEDGLKPGDWNPSKVHDQWFPHMEKVSAALAGALRENSKDAGDAVDRPGLTLMIFVRDGILKFSLSSQEWPRTYYGTITDPGAIQESVEAALKANLGEWSVRREKPARRDRF